MAEQTEVDLHDEGRARHPPPTRGARSPLYRRELVAFLGVAFLASLVVATATLLISRRIASEWALNEAERTTSRIADVLIEPLLGPALDGVPGGRAALDHVVDNRMDDGSVALMLVWTPQGEVLYSSDPSVEGSVVTPSPELLSAASGEVVSDLDDEPEVGRPTGVQDSLVEVYAPLQVEGRKLVLEAYFSTAAVDRSAMLLRQRIVPLALGGLLVLQLVQVPIAISMGRRLGRQETERAELVEAYLQASERERQDIAADVHDGPVQELAGVSYALGGLRASLPEAQRPTVDRLVATVRTAVLSLRRLMVQIYPPELSGPGLATAISDLATPLRDRGVTVTVDIEEPLPDLSPAAAATLYRTTRETLSNIARHAEASDVSVFIRRSGPAAVRMTITDDGVGFASGGPFPSEDGHLGLRLVRDRITQQGGTVSISNTPDGGAVVDVMLPVNHGPDGPPA